MILPRTIHAASTQAYATDLSELAGCRRGLLPARQRGQSIVEFGMVVMLFVLLISGIFDFGMLLNARLSISSLSRVLARAAAEDATPTEIETLANQQDHIIGVTTDTFAGYCCHDGDAIVVTITYYSQSCNQNCQPIVANNRLPGDRVMVDVNVKGADVSTPLMRPIFGCVDGTKKHCFVSLNGQTTMRVERIPSS
jgi:Flp pilus assembly protein TadG